jgi:hypothetical protein
LYSISDTSETKTYTETTPPNMALILCTLYYSTKLFANEETNNIEEKRKKQRGNKTKEQENGKCKQLQYLGKCKQLQYLGKPIRSENAEKNKSDSLKYVAENSENIFCGCWEKYLNAQGIFKERHLSLHSGIYS